MIYDIGIVGGGTAGLTAAIYGQRAGKTTIVLEGSGFGGQITSSAEVENYPGIAHVSGSEFSMNLMNQAADLGAELKMEQATGLREEEGHKVIVTASGEIPCKTVILATGMAHRHLGLPKEEKLTGAGVSYCAACDGAFFRGKDVAVVGGGSTALQDAGFLADLCRKVYLVHRRDQFRGEAGLAESIRKRDNVELVLDGIPREILGENAVEGLVVLNKKTGEERTLEVSGIFVAVGQIPKNDIFADMVKLDANGFILAAEDCMTSRPGVFAAGDCRTKDVRQLTTAAADGSVAAVAAAAYLNR